MTTDKYLNLTGAERLVDKMKDYIDAKPFIYLGVCSTAADTANKTATISDFILKDGAIAKIRFENRNTATAPTLNINDTGAKPIWTVISTLDANTNVYGYEYAQIPSTNYGILGPINPYVTLMYDANLGSAGVYKVIDSPNLPSIFPQQTTGGKAKLSGTTFYPIMSNGLSSVRTVLAASDTIRYQTVTGHAATTSEDAVEGFDTLLLGNSTAYPNEGNSTGRLILYTKKTALCRIFPPDDLAASSSYYLPEVRSSGEAAYPYQMFTVADKNVATGSATQPVYVTSNGHLAACTYELNKTVPSDAVFTDTIYTHPTVTRTDTTSSDTLDYQDNFTVIDSVTSIDDHVTAVNTKTLTMPKSYIYPVVGTQTASTNAWTGNLEIDALYDGLTIAYYLPYAGTSSYATLTLTLNNDVATTAVPVYAYGTTRMSSQMGAGNTIILTYWNNNTVSERWSHGDYFTRIADTLRKQYDGYKAATAIYRYMLLFTKGVDELLPPNTNSNTTGTGKTITLTAFNPFGQIYYYSSTTTISAAATTGANLNTQYLVDLRYSFNTGKTLTANKAVYVVCDPQLDGTATFASTPIVQTLPTTEDGKIYIYLGQASDTYRVELIPEHPVYQYKNGVLRTITSADLIQSAEIDMFKNIFKRLETNKTSTITWESGSINQTSGATFSSSTRIRTVDFLPCRDYTHITIASGYKYAIYLFSTANANDLIGSWNGIGNVNTAQWQTTEQWIGFNNDYYMKIIMAKTDDTAIDTTIASNLTIYGI